MREREMMPHRCAAAKAGVAARALVERDERPLPRARARPAQPRRRRGAVAAGTGSGRRRSPPAMNPTSASVLDSLRIASPCTADWAAMTGDDQKRFCAQCKLHVHDLSAMSGDEAMAFLRGAGEGRVCVRFHRRADGRVLTRDCPVGLRRRLRQAWLRAAALVAALWTGTACTRTGAVGGNGSGDGGKTPTMGRPALMGEAVMGDVAAPPAP